MVARIGREYNLLVALEKVWKKKSRRMFLSFDSRICKYDHLNVIGRLNLLGDVRKLGLNFSGVVKKESLQSHQKRLSLNNITTFFKFYC